MATPTADLTTPPNVKQIVNETTSDVVRFVEILCEWLVPVVAGIVGLFLGPKIFSGAAIGNALWGLGLRSTNPTSGGANSALLSTVAGAGIIGVAAGSLWTYQESRKGWAGLVSRAIAGFTVGWALGILIGGLNAYFVTGATSAQALGGFLDGFIIQLQSQAQAVPVPAPPAA